MDTVHLVSLDGKYIFISSLVIKLLNFCFHSIWRRANARNVSFKTLYGSQFTFLTQLRIPNYLVILSHRRSTVASLETYPLYFFFFFFCLFVCFWNKFPQKERFNWMSRESVDLKHFVTHILWQRNWFWAKRCHPAILKLSKAGEWKGNPFLSLSNPSEPYISMTKKYKQSTSRCRPLS